ncbi:hypothetical protein NC651_030935 [Populus alba x Populus x berolinensis]|nr:hypothetical protein NC651_030935 [Populus alba x Populus x berolinensis]
MRQRSGGTGVFPATAQQAGGKRIIREEPNWCNSLYPLAGKRLQNAIYALYTRKKIKQGNKNKINYDSRKWLDQSRSKLSNCSRQKNKKSNADDDSENLDDQPKKRKRIRLDP